MRKDRKGKANESQKTQSRERKQKGRKVNKRVSSPPQPKGLVRKSLGNPPRRSRNASGDLTTLEAILARVRTLRVQSKKKNRGKKKRAKKMGVVGSN